MLFNFINRVSSAGGMREALDVSSQRTRAIADRVARATLANKDGFALPGQAGAAGEAGSAADPQAPVDVESEMVALADEQIRFEMTAKLLEKTYQKIRTSIKGQ